MISVKLNFTKAAGQNPGTGFVLAHLSDPHLTSPAGVRLAALLNKRLLGYLSWRRRRRIHCPYILDALLQDIAQTSPDHVAVTGDLTHLGLPDEFLQAARWLQRLGPPERVTVVPGNHDAYVAAPHEKTFISWAPYMTGDESTPAGVYPILRIRGPAALIGLSTARPSAPFLAVGRLGRRQLDHLEALLHETGRLGLLRIVLLHHPPVAGSISWRKRLVDARPLTDVLARQGAELILHGHAHVCTGGEMNAGKRKIPVFGASSASYAGLQPQRRAHYHLCRFEYRGGRWILRFTARAFATSAQKFVAVQKKEIPLPNPRY